MVEGTDRMSLPLWLGVAVAAVGGEDDKSVLGDEPWDTWFYKSKSGVRNNRGGFTIIYLVGQGRRIQSISVLTIQWC